MQVAASFCLSKDKLSNVPEKDARQLRSYRLKAHFHNFLIGFELMAKSMVFVVDDCFWLVALQHSPDFPKERRSVQNTVRIPNTLLYGCSTALLLRAFLWWECMIVCKSLGSRRTR